MLNKLSTENLLTIMIYFNEMNVDSIRKVLNGCYNGSQIEENMYLGYIRDNHKEIMQYCFENHLKNITKENIRKIVTLLVFMLSRKILTIELNDKIKAYFTNQHELEIRLSRSEGIYNYARKIYSDDIKEISEKESSILDEGYLMQTAKVKLNINECSYMIITEIIGTDNIQSKSIIFLKSLIRDINLPKEKDINSYDDIIDLFESKTKRKQ